MEPNKWLELHAPGFDHLSDAERAAIKDFSLLWSLFEAFVLDTYGSATAIVATCAKFKASGTLDISRMAEPITYFQKRYFDGTAFTPAYSGLHLGKGDHIALVERFLKNQSKDHADTLAAVLIIIYRLRNNLFHGRKWSYGIEGQMANFHQASSVLMKVMEF
jgi:hypothetical protein